MNNRLLTYTGVGEHHHAVRVGGERLDERREVGVPNLHTLALRRQLTDNTKMRIVSSRLRYEGQLATNSSKEEAI